MEEPKADNTFTYEQLELLNRTAKHLATAEDLQRDLSTILDWLSERHGLRRGVIALMNEAGTEVQADVTVGDISAARAGLMRYRAGEGVTGRVFATGNPVYLEDVRSDSLYLDRSGLRKGLRSGKLAFLCVPISYRGTTIGTLSADKQQGDGDAKRDLALLLEVAQLLAPFVQRRRLEDRLELFQHARKPGGHFAKLVGRSSPMTEVQNLVAKVADASTTVLITGETGTGKGVVAELVHEMGPRRARPFVEVNCGAIPENLVESELFGHEKGSFTGAAQRRVGVLERAKGGTVLLDEIGELPLAAQTRLLRVLQTRKFERVGGTATIDLAARIIAATNRDLEQEVATGRFRSDLYYRLNVFPIHLPPLRERGKADIMLLVDHFTQRFSQELSKEIHRIDTPAIDMLTAYHWPGNAREVENVIERAVLLADSDVIHGHHLPPSLQMNRYAARQEDHGDFTTRVQNFEMELITEALKDTNGNQTRAAARLGITKRIIQYKVAKYGIDCRRFR